MPMPLSQVRVIDFATTRAELAGRTLAELGADVIKVEPPGGCESRFRPPFTSGHDGDPEESLYWAACGLGKKSVVLDLRSADGLRRAKALIASADVLIESDDPGVMASLGLGYDELSVANPGLIYVSVTPFGQDGPLAGQPSTDLTLEAAGGLLGLQGDGDRPPIPVGYPQASFHGGVQAAADTVFALYEREQSGLGQQLDVSMQAAMVWTLMNATGYPPNVGANPPGYCEKRADPPGQVFPGLTIPRIFECLDGWALYAIALPTVGPRTHTATMRWIEDEGALPEALECVQWGNFLADLVAGKLPVATLQLSIDTIVEFFKTKTKVELQTFAARESALLSAVYTVGDLLTDPQLDARAYWVSVGGRTHPGPFAKLSETPLDLSRPAPSIGEHQALLGELRPATVRRSVTPRRPVFDGLKVADFAWVGVGPLISKALADHGATVVHVESSTRPDILRLLPPFKDGVPGINRAQFMCDFNSSKLGMACDMSLPEGRDLARKVADWADVVVESFTPGNMKKFGLDYASLSDRRPELVMLSTCLRGQTGPESGYTGFGGQGASLSGLYSVTGWPDRPPTGPWGAYTDFINPRYGLAALGAALLHRGATGKGQYIDLAQSEAGIRFMEPAVLDFTVNGRVAPGAGHTSPYASPHGTFRAEGKERYVAIEVETAAQWRALRRVVPLASFGGPEFHRLSTRVAAKAGIEAALALWCEGKDAWQAAELLRAAGVPAYAVLFPTDLYTDAQLAHREFFVTLDHGEMGPTLYDGLATRFSATPGRLRNPAPLLGQDTDFVLREILGLSDDEIVGYAAAGVLA